MDTDYADEIHAALTHAGAVVLLKLQSMERGYASLVPHGPEVTAGVELAHAEAAARGVPPGDIAITAPMVMARAQEMGAAGVDPLVVADESKSEEAAKAEAQDQDEARAKAEEDALSVEEKDARAADKAAADADAARADMEEKERVQAQAREQETADATARQQIDAENAARAAPLPVEPVPPRSAPKSA
jgi:hypothetical protein